VHSYQQAIFLRQTNQNNLNMNMRKFALSGVLCMALAASQGQQLHFTSQYLQHNAMYNPAAAGITDVSSIGLSYRSQWSTFSGNPRTFIAYGDANLKKLKAGIAGYVYRDVTGPTNRTGLQLAYSKHIISKDERHKVGLGIELRGLQFGIDKSKLTDALGNDPVLAGANSKIALDAGAGIYYTNGKLSTGIAVSQLIGSKLKLADVPGATDRARLYRHYNFTANYIWQTGDNISLIPNFMLRLIEHAPAEFDFGCRLNYQDKLWWGLNWRMRQFWSVQAGFRILQKVNIGYAYDYYQTPVSLFNGGSHAHELSLRFDMKGKD
jgi:type IX secretion system PorP/SprF family membrane protein